MSPLSDFFRKRRADQSSGGFDARPPAGLTREEETPNHHIRIDLASQVITLDINTEIRGGRAPIPSLRDLLLPRGLPSQSLRFTSAALLGQKAKQFDDGVVAAIALAMQNGSPGAGGKPEFLTTLLTELLPASNPSQGGVVPLVLAAVQLGGGKFEAPPEWQKTVDGILGDFLNDPAQSKPLGFYTWNGSLTDIFRQDRMLQTPISANEAAALAVFLRSRPSLHKQYGTLLALGEQLTNYYVLADLRNPATSDLESGDGATAIFPPCASPEVSLLKRLYPLGTSLPEGFSLIDEVIRHIRSGKLSLAPRGNSGWYEYQLWSLEPLIIPDQTPEAAHLRYYPLYRDHLTEVFKAMYALARETHVKDLERLVLGAAMGREPESQPIYVSPQLTVEPLSASYRRRALGYRFLHHALAELLGENALRALYRERQLGPVTTNLSEELTQMETLFWGAYLVSMHELGFPAKVDITSDGTPHPADDLCWQHFRRWQDRLVDDDDLIQDCRMMVPIFYDLERKQMKV